MFIRFFPLLYANLAILKVTLKNLFIIIIISKYGIRFYNILKFLFGSMLGSLNVQNSPLNLQQLKRKHEKKKLIPRGACQIHQFNKYEYIKNFIANSLFHMYIIPINHAYAPFVVVKKSYPGQKYPIYQLYYHPSKVFLLAAQEQSMNIGCNYIISKQKKPQRNSAFIAKLRGNFSRNEFNIFDNGNNPAKDRKDPRKQFAFIKHEENSIWGTVGNSYIIVPKPRQSLHCIDEVHQYQPLQFYCSNSDSNPILKTLQSNPSTIQKLELKTLTNLKFQNALNFSKAFVLETSLVTQSLMINKKSQTYYELEIGCPLTIIQGFGFLLSLIESQLL